MGRAPLAPDAYRDASVLFCPSPPRIGSLVARTGRPPLGPLVARTAPPHWIARRPHGPRALSAARRSHRRPRRTARRSHRRPRRTACDIFANFAQHYPRRDAR